MFSAHSIISWAIYTGPASATALHVHLCLLSFENRVKNFLRFHVSTSSEPGVSLSLPQLYGLKVSLTLAHTWSLCSDAVPWPERPKVPQPWATGCGHGRPQRAQPGTMGLSRQGSLWWVVGDAWVRPAPAAAAGLSLPPARPALQKVVFLEETPKLLCPPLLPSKCTSATRIFPAAPRCLYGVARVLFQLVLG